MTLTEFLLLRIAEDEWVANTASDIRTGHLVSRDIVNFGDQRLEIAKARVLAECAAKRWIVRLYLDTTHFEPDPYDTALLDVLRVLALLYANHPDFDLAWRP